MAKKQNVYDTVSYDTLKNEINEIIGYLAREETSKLIDSVHVRVTNSGGKMPSITVKIEAKIETQLMTIESCTKILKSLLDKEGLTEFVKNSIELLTMKLQEIQQYFKERPISKIEDRMLTKPFGSKGGTIDLLAASKEDQIRFRTKVSERMLKILPLIEELNSLKETMLRLGGHEIPLRMKLKRI